MEDLQDGKTEGIQGGTLETKTIARGGRRLQQKGQGMQDVWHM